MKKRTVLIPLLGCLVVGGAYGGYRYHEYQEEQRRILANQQAYEALTCTWAEIPESFEYGTDVIQTMDYIKTENGVSVSVEPKSISTDEPGIYYASYTISAQDTYGSSVSKQLHKAFVVSDTKKPVISLTASEFTFEEGESFDVNTVVEKVTDPVDGDLVYAEELREGTYVIETELDPQSPGIYDVVVRAMDKNGNIEETSCSIEVTAKPVIPEAPNIPATAGYPYYIKINRVLNTVTIYTTDENGNYTVPYTSMICSTGGATPLGVYSTFGKSYWRALFGGVYGQYATDIVGDILFHSVPYYSMNKNDLEYDEYNKLGTAASMGCIRLCVRDAKWIFDNCPTGTIVELYDDWDNYGPLGRPSSIYIDPASENRGWDPTDPDPANPWLN